MVLKKRQVIQRMVAGPTNNLFEMMFSGKMTNEELIYARKILNQYYCSTYCGRPRIIRPITMINPQHCDDGTKNHIYIGIVNRYYPISLDTFTPESKVMDCDKYWAEISCLNLQQYIEIIRRGLHSGGAS